MVLISMLWFYFQTILSCISTLEASASNVDNVVLLSDNESPTRSALSNVVHENVPCNDVMLARLESFYTTITSLNFIHIDIF